MTALIEATNLSKQFGGRGLFGLGGKPVRALCEVSLSVARGEAVGLVGESGSGKSTMGRVLLGLTPASGGSVRLDGTVIANLKGEAARGLRRRMQLVFQDPYSSLDPRRRVSAQIADGLLAHGLATRAEIPGRVATLLDQVGLPKAHADRYPHEFSGGQRQRIGIARALAVGPDFLVADEPVSALDVSVQAQVLALLADLRARLGLAMLFISHDLPVVRSLCDRVVVLYLGRVMEEGPAAAVFERPRHPYTRALLSAAPNIDPLRRRRRILLRGDPPSPANPPSGCVFRTRCAWAVAACADAVPALDVAGPGHRVACIRVDDPELAPDTQPDGHQ
ncbi:ATP-binding cassette domain-containing protein [Roseomonas sp. HJA6]|uniref:ATP-binding cassette domain-containing protein n=1 Tax=Roseomonas alba TaxID=2846776 RepID=A0ABS7A7H3_9PROT|nr:oligopeptide/dipeptide ABC transporter ATP-binding protein [Neoroseomonas alba]MBW6398248.1 ATP-binding cassette domain-containing protein [Neoroseomonas alba]